MNFRYHRRIFSSIPINGIKTEKYMETDLVARMGRQYPDQRPHRKIFKSSFTNSIKEVSGDERCTDHARVNGSKKVECVEGQRGTCIKDRFRM